MRRPPEVENSAVPSSCPRTARSSTRPSRWKTIGPTPRPASAMSMTRQRTTGRGDASVAPATSPPTQLEFLVPEEGARATRVRCRIPPRSAAPHFADYFFLLSGFSLLLSFEPAWWERCSSAERVKRSGERFELYLHASK